MAGPDAGGAGHRAARADMPVCAAEFRHGIGFDVCLGEFAVLVQQFEGGAQIRNIGAAVRDMGSSLDTEVGERFSEGLPAP